MPYILKYHIIRTYYNLHSQGILHGSPELHNILVGGDCRVTLIDFSRARAKVPIEALGIGKAHKRDFEFELREVMFKLDYEGARRREGARMDRVEEQLKRNKAREKLRVLQTHDGPVEPDEWLSFEDHAELPPHPAEYNRWVKSLEAPPTGPIIIPGQSAQQLAAANEEYATRLELLKEAWRSDVQTPPLVMSDDYPLPLPLKIMKLEDCSQSEAGRKRRASSAELDRDDRSSKRPRTEASTPSRRIVYECRGSFVIVCCRLLTSVPMADTSRSYSTGTSDILLPAAPPSSSAPEPPPVKVRDFASEAYTGPRGFYVPYPPYEYMVTAHRTAHILNQNAIQSGHLGLPYFRGDCATLMPPYYKRQSLKCFSCSLGTLKRNRAAAEGLAPATCEAQRAAKRQRYLEERAASLAEGENRTVRFSERITYAEYPQFSGDQRISQPECEYNRWLRPWRSCLKKTRPVRTVSYDLNAWLSSSCSRSEPGRASLTSTSEEGEAVRNQVSIDPPDAAAAGSAQDQLRYGPYCLRPALHGRKTGLRIAPGLLRTPDDAEEWEVRNMLIDVPSYPGDPEEAGMCRKSMLDNVCLWLQRRVEPDGSDIWDE